MRISIISLLILYSIDGMAKEAAYITRSPRALLMGDAYTALASEDEYSLFYNPASLGANEGLTFTAINPSFGITNALGELDRFQNFPSNDAPGIADRVLGLPLHLQVGAHPGFKMATIGLSLLAQSTTNIVLRNRVHPSIDIDYRYDRGFIAGFALNLSKSKSSRHSIGFSVKHIEREGIDNSFDLLSTDILNIVENGVKDFNDIRQAVGYSRGDGWGTDAGYEYSNKFGRSKFTFGASLLDIGDIEFRKTEGNLDVPKQEMTLSTGAAFQQDFGLFDYTLSLDMHPINRPYPVERMVHAGFELALPIVSAQIGWNEGYFSYGLGVKMWPVKLYLGFYSVELGNEYREEEGKRAVVLLQLFDLSFDAY